jgi:hypothetical protein
MVFVVYELAVLIMHFCRYSFSVQSGGGVDVMFEVSFNTLPDLAEKFCL